MRGKTLAAALLAATMLSAGPAWALAIVQTSANSGVDPFSTSVNSSEVPALVNEPHVSAVSHASELSAHSHAAAGTLDTCFNAPAGPNCAIVGTDRLANTFASANGNKGTLRAGAHTYIDNSQGGGQTRGQATATLIDKITLNNPANPVIDISIDVTSFGTVHTGGDASFHFAMGFTDPTPDNLEDQGATILFTLEGFRDETGPQLEQGFIAYLLDEPENEFASGSSVPGIFDFEIDLSDPAFTDLALNLAGENEFFFTLTAQAKCDHDPCAATSRLEETLYVKLDGESDSGYSYPGRQVIVDPPPTGDIPEPATALMLLAGLVGIATRARRGRA